VLLQTGNHELAINLDPMPGLQKKALLTVCYMNKKLSQVCHSTNKNMAREIFCLERNSRCAKKNEKYGCV
jgi:hypothetical protein